jgi:hypothetical protein
MKLWIRFPFPLSAPVQSIRELRVLRGCISSCLLVLFVAIFIFTADYGNGAEGGGSRPCRSALPFLLDGGDEQHVEGFDAIVFSIDSDGASAGRAHDEVFVMDMDLPPVCDVQDERHERLAMERVLDLVGRHVRILTYVQGFWQARPSNASC